MGKPTIGMMTFSFNRSVADGLIDVPGIMRYCAELGIDALDVSVRHWADPAKDIPATLEAMRETGLRVAASHTSLDLITPGEETAREREAALRELLQPLAEVQCPLVMIGSPHGDLGPAEWRKAIAVGFRQSLAIGEEYGVGVVFENRGGSAGDYVGTVDHCEEILRNVDDPRLGFTFDVANFRYVSADHLEAFDRLADSIMHVHLKDVVARGDAFRMVPLGEGLVDNRPVIKKLVERGYAGCLSIECGGRGTDKEDARRSADFVKHAMSELAV